MDDELIRHFQTLVEALTGQHGWLYQLIAVAFLIGALVVAVGVAHSVVWLTDQLLTHMAD